MRLVSSSLEFSLLAAIEFGAGCGGGPPSGLAERPSNTTCLARPRPIPSGGALGSEEAFVGADVNGPTDLRRLPAAFPGWIVATQEGEIFALADGATDTRLPVLAGGDLEGLVTGGELGLLGLAVDPAFPEAAAPDVLRIYVNYTASDCGGTCTHVSRFDITVTGTGAAMVFGAGTEAILMRVRQPADNHNGGSLAFGPDQLLYLGFGDGGAGDDPWCSGQNLGTPLGKLLRIDVHAGAPYAIPADNPFRAQAAPPFTEHSLCNEHLFNPSAGSIDDSRGEPCPEILAYGLRNPYRVSFDRVTGWLWIGDVGQDAVEEVDAFDPAVPSTGYGVPNVNFGWPVREGDIPKPGGTSSACAQLPPLNNDQRDPVYVYRHADNESRGVVSGGFVYRGTALGNSYVGRYIFNELYTGELWAMADPYAVEAPVDVNGQHQPLNLGGIGFAEDDDGELYVLGYPVQRLVLDAGTPAVFPEDLVDTGCVDPSDPSRPASGLIPYDLNAALWSDGADKERYLALPDGEVITRAGNCRNLTDAECAAQQDWDLPIGSVLMKVFRRNGELLETRLLMRHDDGAWAGYTYIWNGEGTAATLAPDEPTLLADRDWEAPSRAQCLQCHTTAAGGALGLETGQLNRDFEYASGVTANQLDTLSHIQIFEEPLAGSAVDELAYAALDDLDPVAAARSYLHANCAHCHRPGSPVPSSLDLRHGRTLAEMNACDVEPSQGGWGADVRLLVPGDPDASLLSIRPKATDDTRMPRLATVLVDTQGTALIDAFVESVNMCP